MEIYLGIGDKERCADQLWEFFHDKGTQKATIPGMHTPKVAFEKQCIELELYKVAEEIVNSNFIEEYIWNSPKASSGHLMLFILPKNSSRSYPARA